MLNRYPALILFFLFASGIFLEAVFGYSQEMAYRFFLPFLALLFAAVFFLRKLSIKIYPLLFLLAGMLIFQIRIMQNKESMRFFNANSGEKVRAEGFLIKKLHSRKNNMAITRLTSIGKKGLPSEKTYQFLTFFPAGTLQKIEKGAPFSFQARIEPLKKTDKNHLLLLSKDINGLVFIRNTNDIHFFQYRKKENVFLHAKTFIQDHLDQSLSKGFTSEKAKNIYLALILGKREGLSFDMEEKFKKTGTFHIFSISGLHFATVVFSFLMILNILRIKGRKKLFLLTVLSLFYLFLTGIRVSSLRAFLMMVIAFQSRIFHREYNVLNALGITGLILLLFNPFSLFTPGFQLSFMAVLGILILPQWMLEKMKSQMQKKVIFEKEKNIREHPLIQKAFLCLAVCFAAWLFTAPVLIYHFGNVSLFSSFFNVLVVPLASIVIQIGVFSSLLSIGFPFFSMILNMAAEKLIFLIMSIIDFSEKSFSLMLRGDRTFACVLFAAAGSLLFFFLKRETIKQD